MSISSSCWCGEGNLKNTMWYVIQVMGGQEKASLNLMRRFVEQDVLEETFIPQRETMRHRNGAWETVTETLFPGYLFVVTDDPTQLFDQLRKVPAFTRLLGNDESRFVPLAKEEVALIKALGGDEHVIEMSEGVIEGDEVRILRGPLRDHDGIITKIDRHKRIAFVEMWMLGRKKSIKLGLEIVHKRA